MMLLISQASKDFSFRSAPLEMTWTARLLFFLLISSLLLPACGGPTPTLGIAGQPTLVFIYTDG